MLTMQLLGVVEISARDFQLTVLERRSVRRFLRTVEHEQQRSYSLNLGVGRWMGPDSRYVLKPDPRHFRLMELWSAWLEEKKLDAFVGIDAPLKREMPPAQAPSYGPLPPAPFLAPRAPLPRR
jgi:hypothetical protein